MLACLKKDCYLIWGYCRYLLLVSVVFAFIPYLTGDTGETFYAAYPRLFMGMIPLTLYTYDEREHWCSYCAALPVSRRTYVLAKYLLGLLISAALLLLTFILDMLFGSMGRLPLGLSAGLGLAMSLAVPAATMPFLFWLGAEKGRIVYLIGVAVGAALSVGVLTDLPQPGAASDAVLLLTALGFYALSALLSVALYKKREL